jgi:hypothetical protein
MLGEPGEQPTQTFPPYALARQIRSKLVTGQLRRHDESHHRHQSTAIADLTLKPLVGRVGIEPTTGGL